MITMTHLTSIPIRLPWRSANSSHLSGTGPVGVGRNPCKASLAQIVTKRIGVKLNRREFVLGALAVSSVGGIGLTLPRASQADAIPSLKTLGTQCGLRIGFALHMSHLSWPGYAEFVKANFNLITPESAMKWNALRPKPDQFSFAASDQLMDFARRAGMAVHGHNLCWNTGNPDWFKRVLTRQNAEKYLVEHITTVAGRYAGRMDSWDVVNEPVDLLSNGANGLSGGPWLDLLGPGYIDIAFHAAVSADPGALRILNIHHVEQGDPYSAKARQATLELIQKLVKRQVPLQAVGLESHLDTARTLDVPALTRFVGSIRDLGLEVLLTELDVDDSPTNGDLKTRDEAVARVYRQYITALVPAAKMKRLIFWSVTDKQNWMNYMRTWHRADGTFDHRPALLDENMQPKAAYYSVISALRQGCQRG